MFYSVAVDIGLDFDLHGARLARVGDLFLELVLPRLQELVEAMGFALKRDPVLGGELFDAVLELLVDAPYRLYLGNVGVDFVEKLEIGLLDLKITAFFPFLRETHKKFGFYFLSNKIKS